ncbi:MAG: twin-arginine translocation signal domain-containing protein, partial [Roseiflexaceae bacterium]|nr:twin-arginine translocation signal domain-containing protein [Roseiflexaceae bacterium]
MTDQKKQHASFPTSRRHFLKAALGASAASVI